MKRSPFSYLPGAGVQLLALCIAPFCWIFAALFAPTQPTLLRPEEYPEEDEAEELNRQHGSDE